MTNKSLIEHNVHLARLAHHMAMQCKRMGMHRNHIYWQEKMAEHMRQAREEKNDDPCGITGTAAMRRFV